MRVSVLLVLLLIVKAGFSQPVLEWAKAFTGINSYYGDDLSNGRSIAVDKKGNVYTVGFLLAKVDFDPGPDVYPVNGEGPSNRAIYISKLSPMGDFVWARQIPAAISFGSIELAIDAEDNLLITSYFTFDADMDPGPGKHNLTATGARDAFILKLDSDGNFIWVRQFGGDGYNVSAEGTVVTTDPDGNIIVCGTFYGLVDFQSGPGTFELNSGGNYVAFITSLDKNGNLKWAKTFASYRAGAGSSGVIDVKTDKSGNIYMTGTIGGDCDFDPGPGNYYVRSGGPMDGFVTKLGPDGTFVWAKHIGNPVNPNNYFVSPHGLVLDRDNNVYTSGTFIGPQDFDPGPGEINISGVENTMDAYLLKLNDKGEFVWVKTIGGTEHDNGWDIDIDNQNNLYFSGGFTGSVDFDPGSGTSILNGLTNNEFVLLKLNLDGAFISQAVFRGEDGGNSPGRRIVTDTEQHIFITGHVSGTVDFDPGPDRFTLPPANPWSPYVVKLGKCKNATRSALRITACSSYTLNTIVYEKSGLYTQTIPNAAGCDSVITLDLTLQIKRTEENKSICEGDFVFAAGAKQDKSGIYIDTFKTSLGCDSIVTTNLYVKPKPIPSLGPDKDLCRNTMLDISPGEFASYEWQDGSRDNKFVVRTPGLYWVKVTNDDGCSASDSFNVNAWIEPPVNFLKPLDSICPDQKMTIGSQPNFSDYLWSTGEKESTITITIPGKYLLNVTAANGCMGKDTLVVLRKQDCSTAVYIPNAFTPNADGSNDVFRATVHGTLQSFRLQVFDRAGQLLFQTSDPAGHWNGFYKGSLQPATTFVWQCVYEFEKGKPQYQKGSLTLVR